MATTYNIASVAYWYQTLPTVAFTRDNRAVITYGVYGGPKDLSLADCGAKLRILPVPWFTE